jgi:putative acetyltransferase
MLEITPLRSEQIAEAKTVIYTTAYHIWHDRETLEETIAIYQKEWPLNDIDDFENKYVKNGGIFLVITDGRRVVGTGALHRLEDKIGEIKRLWLLPEYQGQGLGYRMMEKLLSFAREKGYIKLRLETTPAYQVKAFKFYRQVGFHEIPRYSEAPEDDGQVGMEMNLS